jgi:hypothetical protein
MLPDVTLDNSDGPRYMRIEINGGKILLSAELFLLKLFTSSGPINRSVQFFQGRLSEKRLDS